jgi:hypothetical protein
MIGTNYPARPRIHAKFRSKNTVWFRCDDLSSLETMPLEDAELCCSKYDMTEVQAKYMDLTTQCVYIDRGTDGTHQNARKQSSHKHQAHPVRKLQ